jgi:hypothetical protein
MAKNARRRPRTEGPGNGSVIPRAGGGEQPPCQLEPAQSEQDIRLLAEMDKKLQVIRDYAVGVADGRYTGLYVYGPPGSSKSYTILETLKSIGANYYVHNSRLTGQTLYYVLSKAPDAVHVLEDMEGLYRQFNAQGVLHSALWGQRADDGRGPMERWVTWGSSGRRPREQSFLFTGGLIMTANRDLDSASPELAAVKTRICYVTLAPTELEIRALMRHLARQGWDADGLRMRPEECQDVVEYLIAQSVALQRRLDLRLLETCYADYLHWREGRSLCD